MALPYVNALLAVLYLTTAPGVIGPLPQNSDAVADSLPAYHTVSKDSAGYKALIETARSLIRTDPVQSLETALEALMLANELDSLDYISEASVIAGNRYIEFGEYDRSMEHFLRSFEIQQERGNPLSRAILTNNIAAALNQKGDYTKAVDYLQQSLNELPEKEGLQTRAGILMNLGVSYHYMGDYEKSYQYFGKARDLFSDLGYLFGYHQALSNMGEAEMELGRIDPALKKTETSLRFFRERNVPLATSITLASLAKIHYRSGAYNDALNAIDEALETAESVRATDQLKEQYELRSQILESLDRMEESLAAYKLFKLYGDSVSNSERDKRSDFLQARLDLLSKERQIELLVQQADHQLALNRYYQIGILATVIATCLLIYVYYQKHRVSFSLEEQSRKIGEQNRELHSLGEERNEFINMAAHELKNSLNAIMSISDFIRRDQALNEEQDNYMELLERSAKRMNHTLSDFLQVQSAGQQAEGETTDFTGLVLESVINYRAAAEHKSIKLETEIPDSLPVIGIGKRAAVNIIENLLSNAIKYSIPDTTIRVRLESENSKALLSVKDEGPGIPEKEQNDLFKKFKTLSTRGEDSTGLGLYIVKKQVDAAGGRIWCESRLGEGTAFFVELPVVSPS